MKTRITKTEFAGYGHKKITIEYRGKEYTAVTNDMPTFDEINREVYSQKDERIRNRARRALIDFVKMRNGLK